MKNKNISNNACDSFSKPQVALSIFAGDFLNLENEISKIEKTSAEMIHIDIMDGVFVPNISLPLSIVGALKKRSSKVLDVHLMIAEPYKYVKKVIEDGADEITVHFEINPAESLKSLKFIKSKKLVAGVSIKPGTCMRQFKKFLELHYKFIDKILVMGVEPGYSGQKFIEKTPERVVKVRKLLNQFSSNILIEVDGGVCSKNSASLIKAGANQLVVGSAIMQTADYEKGVIAIKNS